MVEPRLDTRTPLQKNNLHDWQRTWPTLAPSEIPRGKLPREAFEFGAFEIARDDVANQLISLQNLEGSSVGLRGQGVRRFDVSATRLG